MVEGQSSIAHSHLSLSEQTKSVLSSSANVLWSDVVASKSSIIHPIPQQVFPQALIMAQLRGKRGVRWSERLRNLQR